MHRAPTPEQGTNTRRDVQLLLWDAVRVFADDKVAPACSLLTEPQLASSKRRASAGVWSPWRDDIILLLKVSLGVVIKTQRSVWPTKP